MKNHHLFKQAVKYNKEARKNKQKESNIYWWQLSLIGIGSIIGAGFFLGTGLSIKIAGPSVLLGYLFAGVTTFFVFSALAEMTVNDPETGSFRTYARKAYGHSLSFVSGWMYWLSGILIMSSEIIALSTFTQFWFPNVPLWIFTVLYAILGFGINLLGVKNFGQIESLFAVVKLSTLVFFIIFGGLYISGMISPGEVSSIEHSGLGSFFPNGVFGLWSALIFIFFSFGGIAVVGIASTELKDKNDISKAGFGLIFTLVLIYLLSLYFVLEIINWTNINESTSPFVTALSAFQIPYIDSIFNIIIISAAFSTMVGSLYSISQVIVSLSEDGDAPKSLKLKNQRGVALNALFLNAIGLTVSFLFSYFLSNTIYEYITTSAGVILILNWIIILASHIKLHPTYKNKENFKMFGYPFTSYLGISFILIAISGALLHSNERMGFFISIGLIMLIFIVYKLIRDKR